MNQSPEEVLGIPLPDATFLLTFRNASKGDRAAANDAARTGRVGHYLMARASATLQTPVPDADIQALGASDMPPFPAPPPLEITPFADEEVTSAVGH
eukprot:5660230-Pyramimonas_sp.AAC.1